MLTRGGWRGARRGTNVLGRAVLLAALLACWGRSPAFAQDDDKLLIEVGLGYFADDSSWALGPSLVPSQVQIYQSGRIVFWDDRGVWEGRIDEKRLRKLRQKLSRAELLKKSQLLSQARGTVLGNHGGMAFVRYLDPQEVIVAVYQWPRRGPWLGLVRLVNSYRPSSYHNFVPKKIAVSVSRQRSLFGDPVPWPFKSEFPLEDLEKHVRPTVSDPRVINFVLRHLSVGFVVGTNVSEDGNVFTLHLGYVPGWYDPSDLQEKLGKLVEEDERAQGKQP